MKRKRISQNKVVHYLSSFFIFPALAGTVTGIIVFLFKLLAEFIMERSLDIYTFVGSNLVYLPHLMLGAAVLGMISRRFYELSRLSSGGGIPTAIAALRGQLPFKWIRTFICVYFSSMCTYLSGVPLDTEGPAVQIGTCIGRGVSRASPNGFKGSDRYIMTGGACAGIAVATGAPISGIFFALEDTHRRFTPTIFISAAVGVICGSVASGLMERLFGVSFSYFIIPKQVKLDFEHIWIILLIAILAVAINTAILFVYGRMNKLKNMIRGRLTKRMGGVLTVVLFMAVALCGVFFHDSVGTGHHLTDEVILRNRVWYLLVIAIILRGLFVPAASREHNGRNFRSSYSIRRDDRRVVRGCIDRSECDRRRILRLTCGYGNRSLPERGS